MIAAQDSTGWHEKKSVSLEASRAASKMLHQASGATGYASIKNLSSDDVSLTTRLSVGDKTAILRYFQPEGTLALNAFECALDMHEAVEVGELFPTVFGTLKEHRAILFEEVTGGGLSEYLTSATIEQWSNSLGCWFGQFSSLAKATDTNGNWYNYLLLHFVKDADQIAKHKRFLQETPIDRMVFGSFKIGLNDFVIQPDGSLTRRRDPSYTLKPDLWELLLCARLLLKLNLLEEKKLLEALISGWRVNNSSCALSRYRLLKLVRIFNELTPMKGQIHKQARMARYTDAINAKRDGQLPEVKATFLSPHFENRLVDVDQALVENLSAHLKGVMAGLVEVPQREVKSVVRSNAAQKPNKLLSALCTACAGNCCSRGLKNFAYLNTADLRSVQMSHPELSDDDVVDHYIAQLPDKHADTGCLYQGKRGCALPRDMRSFTCNNYLCSHAQRAADRGFAMTSQNEPVLIVSVDDEHDHHFTLFGKDQLHEVIELYEPDVKKRSDEKGHL